MNNSGPRYLDGDGGPDHSAQEPVGAGEDPRVNVVIAENRNVKDGGWLWRESLIQV